MKPSQLELIQQLRALGYAVIIWTPEEVGAANPVRVEDRLVELGWDVIADLQQEPEESR